VFCCVVLCCVLRLGLCLCAGNCWVVWLLLTVIYLEYVYMYECFFGRRSNFLANEIMTGERLNQIYKNIRQ
jgi:hypothetical protein